MNSKPMKPKVRSSSYKFEWDFEGKSLRQFLMFQYHKSDCAATTSKLEYQTGILADREHYIKLFMTLSGNVYVKIAIGNTTSPTAMDCPIYSRDIEIRMGKQKTTSIIPKYYDFKPLNEIKIHKFVGNICTFEDLMVNSGESVFWFRMKKIYPSEIFGVPIVHLKTLMKQNDTMILNFTFKIFHNNFTQQNNNMPTRRLSSTPLSAESSSLTKKDRVTKSYMSTENLFMSTEFSDCVIRCGDKTFPAHKIILANKSPIFCKMLQESLVEISYTTLTIEDFDSDTVEQFIKFLYTGEADLEKYAAQLFLIAEKYVVDGLRLMTRIYLMGL